MPVQPPTLRQVPKDPDPRAPRSCLVCGSPRAWFGYGPPGWPNPFYVCAQHRLDPTTPTSAP